MTQEQFAAMMPYICSDLVEMISKKMNCLLKKQSADYIPQNYTSFLKMKRLRCGITVQICFIRFTQRAKNRYD